MSEHDESQAHGERETYEAPTVTDLGSLSELTQGELGPEIDTMAMGSV